MTSAKEPGQIAYETYFRGALDWLLYPQEYRAAWGAVERAIREDERDRCARIAKSAWLSCPYGEIADADAMCALSEHTEAAIRARAAE